MAKRSIMRIIVDDTLTRMGHNVDGNRRTVFSDNLRGKQGGLFIKYVGLGVGATPPGGRKVDEKKIHAALDKKYGKMYDFEVLPAAKKSWSGCNGLRVRVRPKAVLTAAQKKALSAVEKRAIKHAEKEAKKLQKECNLAELRKELRNMESKIKVEDRKLAKLKKARDKVKAEIQKTRLS